MRKSTYISLLAGLTCLFLVAFLAGCSSDTTPAGITGPGGGGGNTAPVLPPSGLFGASKAGEVTLSWNPSPSSGVTHYAVFMSVDGTDFARIGTARRTEFRKPALIPDSEHWFRVTAVSPDRESSPTRSVFVRTVADPSIFGENDLSRKKYGEQL